MQNDSNPVADNTNSNQPKVQGVSNNPALADMQKKVKVEEISEGIFRATTEKSLYVIEYDINKCIGAASCAAIAPMVFFMNEENKAEFKTDSNEDEWDEDDVVMSAAQSCPVFAIKVIEKSTGTVLFPLEEMD